MKFILITIIMFGDGTNFGSLQHMLFDDQESCNSVAKSVGNSAKKDGINGKIVEDFHCYCAPFSKADLNLLEIYLD